MKHNIKVMLWLYFSAIMAVLVIASAYSSFHSTKTHGVVKGILWASEDSVAIIDNAYFKEGDPIHGVTVSKIHKDAVEFKKDQKTWTQRVGQKPDPSWNE